VNQFVYDFMCLGVCIPTEYSFSDENVIQVFPRVGFVFKLKDCTSSVQ
jgi:hypothetical protein